MTGSVVAAFDVTASGVTAFEVTVTVAREHERGRFQQRRAFSFGPPQKASQHDFSELLFFVVCVPLFPAFLWMYSSSPVLPVLQKYRYMLTSCTTTELVTYRTFLNLTAWHTVGAGMQASWSRDAPFEVRMSAGHEIFGSIVVVWVHVDGVVTYVPVLSYARLSG